MNKKSARFVALMASAAVAVAVPAVAPAQGAPEASQRRQSFNIPAQDLGKALTALARQSNREIYFPADLTRGKRAPAVSGEMTADQALQRLLAGSGLAHRLNSSGAITIERAVGNAFAGAPNAATESASPPSAGETASSSGIGDNSEIVVIGTTLSGIYPASSPVTIYTEKDIARSAATTTEQFVGKLSQNLGTFSQFAAGSAVNAGNPNSVTSVDLRGLGVGTTLTLVNGRRIAASNSGQSVDVSLIPASAISRVEVLTDGASAIYGSDAIGGVINFVLKDDYDGAETRVFYGGVTDGGMRQFGLGQTVGADWSGGRALIAYNMHSATKLERSERSFSRAAGDGSLTPDDLRHNIFATAQQRISDRLRVDVDLGYVWRKVENEFTTPFPGFPTFSTFSAYESRTEQAFGGLGARYNVRDDVTFSIDVGYSKTVVDGERASVFFNRDPVPPPTYSDFSTSGAALDASAKLEANIFELPGGDVRFAIGGGALEERFRGISAITNVQSAGKLGRRTMYGFSEVFVPLAVPSMNLPFVRRFELSFAARYTDYQDISDPPLEERFGSSIDPKIGLLWAPAESLSLRGTYGRSFRAPTLTQLDRTSGVHYILSTPIAGEPAMLLAIVAYPAPDLKPETAKTYTLGFDFKPLSLPGMRFSGSYYSIDYTNRIGTAPTGGVNFFGNPSLAPDVIYRAPSAAFIEEALRATPLFANLNQSGIDLSDPAVAAPLLFDLPNLWIYDQRTRNLAVSRQKGMDISLSQRFPTSWGEISLAANATHIFSYKQRGSPNAQTFTAMNIPGGPPDWRGRVSAGLSRGGFDGTVSVNYVGSYENPWVDGSPRVDSWTTVDLSLVYDVSLFGRAIDKDLRLSLSAQNLFDADPPFLGEGSNQAILAPIGFDPANANPLGRLIVLGVAKRW